MCGRYKLEVDWQEYCANPSLFDWDAPPYPFENPFTASDEVFPRERMPILRRHDDGRVLAELRQWGFILSVDGKTVDPATGRPKRIRKDVINAMSEKLRTSPAWRVAYRERRCLVPMSAWDEWPTTTGGKRRMRVSMPATKVFMVAGLYETSHDPKRDAPVDTYTIVTVPPNAFLGTVHDRAPMVLLPDQYAAWLAGGSAAERLLGVHPDADVFDVQPVAAVVEGDLLTR